MTEYQVRQIIRDELRQLLVSDRYIFYKNIQILNGRNIQVGKSTGTKIGIEATQKLAFYGEIPVVQASAIGAPDTPSVGYVQSEAQSAVDAINSIRTALSNIGITA